MPILGITSRLTLIDLDLDSGGIFKGSARIFRRKESNGGLLALGKESADSTPLGAAEDAT